VRRLGALLLLVAVTATAALATGAGDGADGRYRVDVIFDNVFGVVPGQDVRIAGATVGEVDGLEVTPDNRARVQLLVDPRFAPFRGDASCTIQPQSLIGEKFVQCAPGSPAGTVLPQDDGVPTVPVRNTVAPVDLSLVLGTFDRPARERLSILLGSLGAGLAGRGKDLNATIRRAAPALTETNRVLRILDRDRARLRQLADDGDSVLAELARRKRRVAAFVRATAAVTATTAERRERLAAAVRGLPALLGEAQPALQRLTTFTRRATPLARELNTSAPDLTALLGDTRTFATQIRPSLQSLTPSLRTLRRALPVVEPQARRLRRFATGAKPTIDLLEDLFTSSEDNGVLDGLGSFFYYGVAATARFDRYGHYLPAYQMGGGSCGLYATTPVAGCSGHIGEGAAAPTHSSRRSARGRAPRRGDRAPGGAVRRTTPVAPSAPKPPIRLPGLPALPDVGALTDPQQLPQALQDAIRPLLGEQRRSAADADSLLGYLLG